MYNDTLAHHGVKGQKWGVRRYQNSDGTLTAEGKKRVQKYVDKSAEKKVNKLFSKKTKSSKEEIPQNPKYKKASELSDKELNDAINRFRLEESYNSYISKMTPQKKNKAKEFISDVLEKSGKNIATQATTYAMGTAVNKLARQLGIDDDVVNPKKGQKDK